MFAVEVALGKSATARDDKRAHARTRSDFAASARSAREGRFLCKVADISQSGVRLRTFSVLEPGSRVELALLKGLSVPARVVWSDELEAGCSFDEALSETLVDLIVRSQGTADAPVVDTRPITYI